MVARTVKIMGLAYSTSGDVGVTIDYNGSRVFDGTVPTVTVEVLPNFPADTPDWLQDLGTFTTDTDTTGSVPVTITVTGGRLFFGNFWMNYIGAQATLSAIDPDVEIDYRDSETFVKNIIVDTQDNYGLPTIITVESDGISNTRLNDSDWNWRTGVIDELASEWAYPVSSGDVFGFDFFVDPEQVRVSNIDPEKPRPV